MSASPLPPSLPSPPSLPPSPLSPTVGDLCQYVNSKLNRSEQAPLFIYANNEIVTSLQSVIAEIYQEFREDDFFLYLGYYEENIYADKAKES